MSNNKDLTQFREKVQALLKNNQSRPFVCSGSPLDCKVFIVGFNSATELGHPFFQRYWSDELGFLRDVFDKDYLATRKKRGVRPRIEAIVKGAAPVPCLETNIYSVPTPKASRLSKDDKDSTVFELLLSEIKPDVILLHSNKPIEYFRKYTEGADICGNSPVQVTINGHRTQVLCLPGPLYRRKVTDAELIGKILRNSITV